MRRRRVSFAVASLLAVAAASGQTDAPAIARPPAVTIYNQNFGVVRETLRANLASGVNRLSFSEITAHVEPQSVILRDLSGKRALRVREQNYRADPLSQELLLSVFEGREIEFLIAGDPSRKEKGRIVRSGYAVHEGGWQRYGWQYWEAQRAAAGAGGTPIIEIDGVVRFGLPGQPLFPNLGGDSILRPTLHWTLETDAGGSADLELSYVTGGMSWLADYNVLETGQQDQLDLIGWVTVDNQTGRTFENATLKLMAGDVSKLDPALREQSLFLGRGGGAFGGAEPQVSERAFDEYHLYTLNDPTTLRDRETKQVEFVRAERIPAQRLYVYNGSRIDHARFRGWGGDARVQNVDYGPESNRKIWTMREFKNSAPALGIPLPAGRMRFYRKDDDGRLEFVGENDIDHTPRDETVRVYTGNAFDLVGERVRTHFQTNSTENWTDESFQIRLRNRRAEPVEIRVTEDLYRGNNWKIIEPSHEFQTLDSHSIEFRVSVPAGEEVKLSYKVHYSW